jgi:hypothetical protein
MAPRTVLSTLSIPGMGCSQVNTRIRVPEIPNKAINNILSDLSLAIFSLPLYNLSIYIT